MHSQIGGRLPLINSNDQKSPYLLQYKIFEERLKRQQRKNNGTFVAKSKKTKSQFNEDYIQLARNILSKKQNFNLLEDLPCETEPNITTGCSQQLAIKTRSLFEKNQSKKKSKYASSKEEALSQIRQNSTYIKSRVQSEATTHVMRKDKLNGQCITFIGYKRNKKPVVEQGFKKIFGLI